MTEYDKLITSWKSRRSAGETYESIARSYPAEITRAHVYKIMKGWEPDAVHLRQALGLPTYKPAPVCKCGEVHTTKRCTKNTARKAADLFSLPVAELRRRLEEREEV